MRRSGTADVRLSYPTIRCSAINPLTYMLYGHVHNTHDERLVNEFIRITRSTMVKSARQTEEHPIPCNMINCFCMFSDYIPLTLDDWIRLDKGRREEADNKSDA